MGKIKDANEAKLAGKKPKDRPFKKEDASKKPGDVAAAPLPFEQKRPTTFGELEPSVDARLERRAKGVEKPVPVPFPTLAAQMGGGWWPGVYMLVGGTGTGKSQLALQLALAAARAGSPAAYVGLELDELQLGTRVKALAAHEDTGKAVFWSHLYYGEEKAPRTAPGDWKKRLHLLAASPYSWSDLDLLDLGKFIRETYPEKTPGAHPFLLIVDFLQLVTGANAGGRTLDLRERIGRASYAAAEVARDQNAAVLLVSSTAREHYTFDKAKGGKNKKDSDTESGGFGVDDPRQYIGMGKESGEIEYSAHNLMVLGERSESSPSANGGLRHVALAFAKTRALSKKAGSRRYVDLTFDGTLFREDKAAITRRAKLDGGAPAKDPEPPRRPAARKEGPRAHL